MLPGLAPLVTSNDILVNDFSQYTAGTTPGDWTNRYVTGGFTYVVQTVSGSISGKALRWTKTAANRQAISWNAVPNATDFEVLVRLRSLSAPASTAAVIISAFVRGAGAAGTETGIRSNASISTLYLAGLGGVIQGYVSGTATTYGSLLAPVSSPSYTANTWLYMRLRVQGSTCQWKIWFSGTAEQSSWNDTQTITSPSAAGWAGLYQADPAPNAEIDYFAVSLQGRTIPVPV